MRLGTFFSIIALAAFLAATVYGYKYYIEGKGGRMPGFSGGSKQTVKKSRLRVLVEGRDPYGAKGRGSGNNAKKSAKASEDLIRKMNKRR